ncbi:MAG: hypothetical protein K9K37_05940 [Desulfocapsa sp.]|nr:hypothetical protein [Desulfocapsa sp.]
MISRLKRVLPTTVIPEFFYRESSLKYHLYQEMTPISESWLSFSGNQIIY